LLERGARVGYAEDAIVFTNVPTTYRAFFNQRKRWSRGLIEAFRAHPKLLFKARPTTVFIYWNFLFPVLDAAYISIFVPGIIAALFGHFYVVGPMTLSVLPLALLVNYIMYRTQLPMFESQGLSVRRNFLGLMLYMLLYCLVLNPATIAGYLSEFIGLRKAWGTK
jgi:biofilm PGA synthesis N-glycosyltransferase PgaC